MEVCLLLVQEQVLGCAVQDPLHWLLVNMTDCCPVLLPLAFPLLPAPSPPTPVLLPRPLPAPTSNTTLCCCCHR
jgi:hypothetical protein